MVKRYGLHLATLALCLSALTPPTASASTIALGAFDFDSNLFGDTLAESDGGTFRASNWLNVANADPGTGALTGANFDTGIANIGLFGNPIYTIGYSAAIVNRAGDDFAIVDATFSAADTYRIAVSSDGSTFSPFMSAGESLGTDTGVTRSYFYSGTGPFTASLNVIPLDLSSFGIASGVGIVAVQITGAPEADLIRVAGFDTQAAPVPEPASFVLLATGLLTALSLRRRGHRKA